MKCDKCNSEEMVEMTTSSKGYGNMETDFTCGNCGHEQISFWEDD